jgi:acyl-[acyl-carrier-protein]-phospholipid O-acyltransferase / long-chain-fatty-acid--[acyl-carrier-protein] ligase
VLVTSRKKASRQEILAFFKQHGISELNIPKHIIVLDKVPLLGTGKTDYVSVQKRVNEEMKK